MSFGADQNQTYDTQCCFFNSARHLARQAPRLTQDGLVGLYRSKPATKPEQPISQQSRFMYQDLQGESSQQKGKISLSKVAGKRTGNYSQDHCQQKQPITNIGASHVSACKSKVSESKPNSSMVSVDFTFNETKLRPLYHQPSSQISFSNLPIKNQNTFKVQSCQYEKKVQVRPPQIYSVGANLPVPSVPISHRPVRNINFQYSSNMPQQAQVVSDQFTPRPQSFPTQKLTPLIPNPPLASSVHKSQINSHQVSMMNMKGVQTIAPTIETDRKMILSQYRESQVQDQTILGPGSVKNNSHIFQRPQSQYAESRMVETVMPNLGRAHLKTVQSVYGSEIGIGKKQMQQSVILIDFFNPSQNLRKEIEEKIFNQPYPEHF